MHFGNKLLIIISKIVISPLSFGVMFPRETHFRGRGPLLSLPRETPFKGRSLLSLPRETHFRALTPKQSSNMLVVVNTVTTKQRSNMLVVVNTVTTKQRSNMLVVVNTVILEGQMFSFIHYLLEIKHLLTDTSKQSGDLMHHMNM